VDQAVTATNFPACLAFTLAEEGGWSDDPDDPGGCTNQGITLVTYRLFHDPDATPETLRAMTDAERDLIYREGYWDAVAGDNLPAGLDLMTFDFGVNAGPVRSVARLQIIVGTEPDGVIGPLTLKAITGIQIGGIIDQFFASQRSYYTGLAGFPTFGKGWLARCERRVALARQMAGEPDP